jgi:hypothetical protein
MRTVRLAAVFGCAIFCASPSLGSFLYDHIYVAVRANTKFLPRDETIWEFDPATGTSRQFVDIPPAYEGTVAALAFTPDHQRLRAGAVNGNHIMQIDGNGGIQPFLAVPGGPDDMAWNSHGDFFVLCEYARQILRYPAEGGPPSVFADASDGIDVGGSMAIGTDDSIYWTQVGSRALYRFTSAGDRSLLYEFASQPGYRWASLTVSDSNTVFAVGTDGIHRFENGNASAHTRINSNSWPTSTSIRLSADESHLYCGGGGGFVAVDPSNGTLTPLGLMPLDGVLSLDGVLYRFGPGFAVYTPEPASCSLLLFFCYALRGR